MPSEWGPVLEEAADLLRRLPRKQMLIPQARADVEQWACTHPEIAVVLHADRAPSSLDVDYDLALRRDDEGVIGLTWQPSDGLPWLVRYADHWASNLVVTVNGRNTTVQQALLMLRVAPRARVDLLTEVVNQQLLLAAAEERSVPVTQHDVQEAADALRRSLGLESAQATFDWLREMRLPREQFDAIARSVAQTQKLLEDIAAPARIRQRFEAEPQGYARLAALVARTPTSESAEELASDARRSGDLAGAVQAWIVSGRPVSAELTALVAKTSPPFVRDARAGSITAGRLGAHDFAVAQLFHRAEPVLDDPTRSAVSRELVDDWLAAARSSAEIEWHWT